MLWAPIQGLTFEKPSSIICLLELFQGLDFISITLAACPLGASLDIKYFVHLIQKFDCEEAEKYALQKPAFHPRALAFNVF